MAENDDDEMYNKYMVSAKMLYMDGLRHQAMEHLVMASSYKHTAKVIRRIHQLQKLMDAPTDDELVAPQTACDSNCTDVTSDKECPSGYSSTIMDGSEIEDENLNSSENANGSNSADLKSDIECFSGSGYCSIDKDGDEIEDANFNLPENVITDNLYVKALENGLLMDIDFYCSLPVYQLEGIQWLWNAVHLGNPRLAPAQRIKCGLLGDDDGFDKTTQVVAFIKALLDMDESGHFLIIVPAVRVSKWEGEIKKWIPKINVTRFLASKHLSTCNRNKSLDKARASGTSIVITTYGICRNCTKDLNSYQGQDWIWQYVIMDEAHFVKSPTTQTSRAIDKIESMHRLLITEWPIMSNLDDFYGLMNAMCKGLGRQHCDQL